MMNRAAGAARLSILSNSCLITMKLVVGFMSGSVSIISEAIHSFMDLMAAVMAFFAIRIANRPADHEHPYGHDKAENVSGVLEAVLILVAAALIVYESIRKLIRPEPIEHLELGVAVMVVSGLANIVVSRYLYRVARKYESVALEADALHLKTDVYSSLGVAIGLVAILLLEKVFSWPGASYFDPVIAMLIALFIMKEAIQMVAHAFGPLLDASLSDEELAAVEAVVAGRGHISMHDVRTRRAGGKRHVDFHLTVPESMSVKESHELCDELERTIGAAMGNATVLIHVEPSIVLPGPETASIDKDGMQKRIDAIGRDLLGADPHVHHLHVFDAGAGTELSFHMTIDPSRSVDEAHRLANEYEERIEAELGFEATIHIEPRRAGGSEGA